MQDPCDDDEDGAPNLARAYDFLIKQEGEGGYSLPADRRLARELTALDPGLPGRVRAGRAFICEAARRAAAEGGISQFLDLGAGCPALPSVVASARSVIPLARGAVVDCDEDAETAWLAAAGHDPGIAVIRADLTSPETVLGSKLLTDLIDLERPVCVLLGAVLHYSAAAKARAVVGAYMDAAARGSWLAISTPYWRDQALLRQVLKIVPVPVFNHSEADFRALFSGLEVARIPGSGIAVTLAGVGVKNLPAPPAAGEGLPAGPRSHASPPRTRLASSRRGRRGGSRACWCGR